MPQKAQAQITAGFVGQNYTSDVSVNADVAVPFSPSVAAALAGTLTTRTDNTSGTVTMAVAPASPLVTGALVDLYWTGGSRRSVVVGTIAGSAVPISGGSGDNLPVASTAVTVAVQNSESVAAVGNNCQVVAVQAGVYRQTVVFKAAGGGELLAVVTPAGGNSYLWTSSLGTTNPLAGVTVATVTMTHESTAGAAVVSGAVGYN